MRSAGVVSLLAALVVLGGCSGKIQSQQSDPTAIVHSPEREVERLARDEFVGRCFASPVFEFDVDQARRDFCFCMAIVLRERYPEGRILSIAARLELDRPLDEDDQRLVTENCRL